jgi:hypothetical protein
MLAEEREPRVTDWLPESRIDFARLGVGSLMRSNKKEKRLASVDEVDDVMPSWSVLCPIEIPVLSCTRHSSCRSWCTGESALM